MKKVYYFKFFTVFLSLLVFSACILAGEVPTKATIRNDGILLIDGKPIFPIAIEPGGCRGEHLKRIAKAGFNIIRTQGELPASYIDEAYKNGLYVIARHCLWATFCSSDPNMNLFAKEKAGMKLAFKYREAGRTPLEAIKAFDAKPGVFGWNLSEEPPARFTEPLEFMYEIFKSHSPKHIMFTISADPVWYHTLYNTCDILIIDNYPFRGKRRSQPLIWSYEWTRKAVKAMKGKPVWFMMQIYNMVGDKPKFNPALSHEPTLSEMRQQMYLALIAGAKGIFMWTYPRLLTGLKGKNSKASPKLFEQRWQKVIALTKELKQLSPILIDSRVCNKDEIRLDWYKPGAHFSRVLEYNGDKYLLVANIGDNLVNANVVGTNYGNFPAYNISVVHGKNGLSIGKGREGYPSILIKPHSCGVFLLKRRPVQP